MCLGKAHSLSLHSCIKDCMDIDKENLMTQGPLLCSALPSCPCLDHPHWPGLNLDLNLLHCTAHTSCSRSAPRGKVQSWTLACGWISLAGKSPGSWLTQVSSGAKKLSSLWFWEEQNQHGLETSEKGFSLPFRAQKPCLCLSRPELIEPAASHSHELTPCSTQLLTAVPLWMHTASFLWCRVKIWVFKHYQAICFSFYVSFHSWPQCLAVKAFSGLSAAERSDIPASPAAL